MSASRKARLAVGGALAARAALAGAAAVSARSAGAPWRRMNYAKRPVSLLGGPALALSATATSVLGAPAGARVAAAVVGTVSGLVGGYDDLAGARPEQARRAARCRRERSRSPASERRPPRRRC